MTSLVVVAHAQSEPEAVMLCARLDDAGIRAVSRLAPDIPQFGAAGGRDIYVEDHLARAARELLQAPDFTDEELAQLSDQAAKELLEDPPA